MKKKILLKSTASINTSQFFQNNTSRYKTFVWFGKKFIEIAVTDFDCKKIEVVQSFIKTNGNITHIEALKVFQMPAVKGAAEIFVGLESNKSTLVPAAFFEENQLNTYLKSIFHLEPSEAATQQKLSPIDSYSVFTIKKGTQKLLEDTMKDVTILHAPSSLLLAYQKFLPTTSSEFSTFIRCNRNDVTISLYKDKQLQLHQSYDIDQIEDALYYYLHALQVYNFNKAKTEATIFGHHSDIEKLKTLLTGNIESVKYSNRLPNFQYTEEISNEPTHQFFNLFALVLCA